MTVRRRIFKRRPRARKGLKKWRARVTYHEPTYDLRRGNRKDFIEKLEVRAANRNEAIENARGQVAGLPSFSQVSWIREVSHVEVEQITGFPGNRPDPYVGKLI